MLAYLWYNTRIRNSHPTKKKTTIYYLIYKKRDWAFERRPHLNRMMVQVVRTPARLKTPHTRSLCVYMFAYFFLLE